MNENHIKKLLDELAQAQDALTMIGVNKQGAKDMVLTSEIMQQLEDIDAEYEEAEQAAQEAISRAETAVKTAVINHGSSVKTELLNAVYSGGRVSYDPKALDGLLIAMPELAAFRRESAPSVSIRQAKGK